jgi:hypothetical protein
MRKAILAVALLALQVWAAPPAGMDPERLARIPARMKQFVERGSVAGTVTLVARHGTVASLEATVPGSREEDPHADGFDLPDHVHDQAGHCHRHHAAGRRRTARVERSGRKTPA